MTYNKLKDQNIPELDKALINKSYWKYFSI